MTEVFDAEFNDFDTMKGVFSVVNEPLDVVSGILNGTYDEIDEVMGVSSE